MRTPTPDPTEDRDDPGPGEDAAIISTTRAHPGARRGRGALSNTSGRYERHGYERLDDGWDSLDAEPPPLPTRIVRDTSKSVIATNQSPDLPFERSLNPYRGCEHGCIYCFARPTHAYLGYSPGLDFETTLLIKPDAPALLERELRRPGYVCKPLAMGTNTDPYQPLERRLQITREILKVLQRFNHPVGIVTKSRLVVRDLDILAPMAERGLARVALSVTTLDRRLARRMEPRASTPGGRLQAIRQLAKAGVPTAVMAAPMIPALNDMEMERILEVAHEAGAREASYILLRLPLEIKDLWRDWLEEHYPDRAARVMRHIREARGGKDYDSAWGRRMRGSGPFADLLARRFALACTRLGLNGTREDRMPNRTDLFAPPPAPGDQLSLL